MSVASENSVHFLISIGRSRSFSFQARTRSSCVVRQLTTADSHHLRDPARVVAIAFVDLRLEKRLRVSRFDADRRDSCFRQSTEQPLRQRPSLETDTFKPPCGIAKNSEKVFGVTYHLHFTANPARLVDAAIHSISLAPSTQSQKIRMLSIGEIAPEDAETAAQLSSGWMQTFRPIRPSAAFPDKSNRLGR